MLDPLAMKAPPAVYSWGRLRATATPTAAQRKLATSPRHPLCRTLANVAASQSTTRPKAVVTPGGLPATIFTRSARG